MRLMGTVLICFATSLLVSNAILTPAQAEDGFIRTTPEQLKWVSIGDGAQLAVLYGNPSTAGAPYVIQVKFAPYTFDYPHYHPEDRHVTVLKGTWYTGTGEALDVEHAIPIKAGGYMFHRAKAVHWDGAKDEEVIVEITGIGPGPSILAKPGTGVFFSVKK
jgi:hypothetical protein